MIREKEIKIDDDFINVSLKRLIVGATCEEGKASKLLPQKGLIYVQDKQVLDASTLKGLLVFEGNILRGGIYEAKNNYYISDTRDYTYTMEGSDLCIASICSSQSFVLKNFDEKSNALGIKLSKNPTKEIGIVVCITKEMNGYIFALKEIAPFLAKHLFGGDGAYAKVTLVSFAGFDANDIGTFYDVQGLVDAINALNVVDSHTRMLYLSIIKAMQNFTKDNGLQKEIYLISNAEESDPQNLKRMLPLTENLNRNIAKHSDGSKENCVQIHCFSVINSIDSFKELSRITNGHFYYAHNSYDFKKNLLTQSSGGTFDMREISTEIRPSKTHKMHDDTPPMVLIKSL